MLKIFPFYNPNFDFDKSIVYEVIHKILDKSVFDAHNAINNLAENATCQPNEIDQHPAELLDVLFYFIDEIERRLNFKTNASFSKVFDEILNSTTEQESKEKLFEIARDFNEAKECILNEEEPDLNIVNRLERAVSGEDESCAKTSMHLITIYTLDTKTIKQYFANLKKNNMPLVLKDCFRNIGVTGVRRLASIIIDEHLNDYDSAIVSDIREYSQLFSLFVTVLSDMPIYDGKLSTRGLIISLLKAAYYDGQITKERQFYSDQSLKVMASIGTSRAMKTSAANSAKDKLKNEATEEIKRLFNLGTRLSHGDIAKQILKNDRLSGLKLYLIERLIREEAKRQEHSHGNSK